MTHSFDLSDCHESIVGHDPALRALLQRTAQVAPTRMPVLISGETGTGKELLARLIHQWGRTPHGPFVAVNCGTLPRELADSELFGHERGAFTGAGRRKIGWFEEASGGTLVLDEIGELPLELQPKLLRILETGRLRRVGGSGEVAVDVRVVTVTLPDLRREIGRGGFRADLYHRLAGFELTVPPLRRRRADIPYLVERFLRDFESDLGPRTIGRDALDALMSHDWPGNVRELRNVVGRAAVLCPQQISAAALDLDLARGISGPLDWTPGAAPTDRPTPVDWGGTEPIRLSDGDGLPLTPMATPQSRSPIGPAPQPATTHPPQHDQASGDLLFLDGKTLDEIERAVFDWALRRNAGSRRAAARALAVPRSSFCDKVRRFGLT